MILRVSFSITGALNIAQCEAPIKWLAYYFAHFQSGSTKAADEPFMTRPL